MRPVALCCALLSTQAFALSQGKHLEITRNSCLQAGYADGACTELAMAAHNVDADEWTDLAAHSQIADGSTACASLTATLNRLRTLGQQVREGLIQQTTTADPQALIAASRQVTVALGRALHTVQDNCAHHGMPNPEHAYASDSDLCRLTNLSPDNAPGAAACAQQQTDAVMAAFHSIQAQLGAKPSQLWTGDPLSPTLQRWPSRGGICGFMDEQLQWDGQDRGWDNAYANAALEDELERGMSGDPSLVSDACALPPDTLALKSPAAALDPYLPIERCEALQLFCVGDPQDTSTPPPWETVVGTVGSGASTGLDHAARACGGTQATLFLGLGLVAFGAVWRRG